MNNDQRSRDLNDSEGERALQQLFAHAEPRPTPPDADAEAIRNAVFAEWEAVTGRRVFARRALAVAASVVVAIAVWFVWAPAPVTSPATVAFVERVDGRVDNAGAVLIPGSAIVEGNVLATEMGQVAFRLLSGGSLRLGPDSRMVMRGADAVELQSGVLYFDSEDQRGGNGFVVATRFGSVRDVGTQFVARLDSTQGSFDVGVRNGRVQLTSGLATDGAGVGERLSVTQDSGPIRRGSISTFGDEWEWAERLAPPFDIDGRTVADFLAWFADQTGRTVVFGNATAERLAHETVLSGSIDLPLMQKLSAVLALTDLTFTFDGERVVIDAR